MGFLLLALFTVLGGVVTPAETLFRQRLINHILDFSPEAVFLGLLGLILCACYSSCFPTMLGRDKTMVFVTHRLGAAQMADRILFMKEGRIAEAGTHEELMALHGEYAAMYQEQAQWYQR